MLEMLKKIWYNPKHRKISILCVLVLVLIGVVIYRYLNIEPPPPEGAIRVVICEDCGKTYTTRIKDIDDPMDEKNKCEACGGKLAIAWKCKECRFEFPEGKVISSGDLENTMQKFQAVTNANRCPNCGSLASEPMSAGKTK